MQLVRCHIENFGKLRDFSMKFDEGCNIICKNNGWGKTTLITFIKVMIFGFDNKNKRNVVENERLKYMPWQGGIYGGELVFIHDNVEYSLKRTFGRTEKNDEIQLVRNDTGLSVENFKADNYGGNIGEFMLKIDRESFAKTAYIKSGQCATQSTDAINAKISNLTEETADIKSYNIAMDSLKNSINRITPKRATGELARLNNQICQLRSQIDDTIHEEYNNQLCILDELTNHRSRLECEKKTIIEKSNMGAPQHQTKDLLSLIMFICIAFFTALAGRAGAMGMTGSISDKTVLVVIIIAIIGIVSIISTINTIRYAIKLQGKKPANVDMMTKLDGVADELVAVTQAIVATENTIDRLVEELNEQREIRQLIMENEEEYERGIEKYSIMCMTKEYLEEAKNSFVSKFRTPIQDSFSELYKAVTLKDDKNIKINGDMSVTIDECGMGRNQQLISTGSQDVIAISLRVAMIKSMFKDREIFMIFDEPFANLDDENTKNAIKMISECGIQSIIFTCKNNDYFSRI